MDGMKFFALFLTRLLGQEEEMRRTLVIRSPTPAAAAAAALSPGIANVSSLVTRFPLIVFISSSSLSLSGAADLLRLCVMLIVPPSRSAFLSLSLNAYPVKNREPKNYSRNSNTLGVSFSFQRLSLLKRITKKGKIKKIMTVR